jgi:hypothetical protein
VPDPLAVAPHAHEDAVIHFQASQAAHFSFVLEFRGQRRDTNTSKTVEFDFTDSKILAWIIRAFLCSTEEMMMKETWSKPRTPLQIQNFKSAITMS